MTVKEMPADLTKLIVAFLAMAGCKAGMEKWEAIARICKANIEKNV